VNREERCSFRIERTGPPDGGRPCLSVPVHIPASGRPAFGCRTVFVFRELYTASRSCCVPNSLKYKLPVCSSALRSLRRVTHSCRLPARRPAGRLPLRATRASCPAASPRCSAPSPRPVPHRLLSSSYSTGRHVRFSPSGTLQLGLGHSIERGMQSQPAPVPVCPLRPVSRTLVPSFLKHRFAMPLALRASGIAKRCLTQPEGGRDQSA